MEGEVNSSIFNEQNDNKKFNDQEVGASSNGSSLMSHSTNMNCLGSSEKQQRIATPSTENHSDVKSTSRDYINNSGGGKEQSSLQNNQQN